MLFLILNSIKNKKALNYFVSIDLSTSVQLYFIHRLALLILGERQAKTEGKTVCTYVEDDSVYVYKACALCRFHSFRLLSR